jgi:cobyrinic acid a,c-diamide synthase
MTSRDYILGLFNRTTQEADMAVVEGVMGLFDGSDPATSEGSTAEIACWLDAPVLLVVNVHGMARSLAAIVKGCAEFDRRLKIVGVIANRCGSDHHKNWLAQSLESASLPPLLGAIPRGSLPALPSRHLGLVTADPENLSPGILEELAHAFETHVAIDAILKIAKDTEAFSVTEMASEGKLHRKRISIGVAHDRAFHFYYPDNLDELKSRGCDLVRFSPLDGRELPEGLDGLYLGGGYPEVFAEALANNREMMEAIREFARRGLPVYAECGGLMYLTQGIETAHQKRFPMVGLLPIWSRMLDRLKSLGYVEVTLTRNSLWGDRGAAIRGHEFHYSELIGDPLGDGLWTSAYHLRHRRSKDPVAEGFQQGRILASYVHIHWASQPQAMETFIARCGADL